MLTISLNLLTRIQATWQRNTLKKKNAETQSDNFATRERNTRVIIKRTIRRAKCATDVIRAVMQRARIVLTSSSMIPSMRRTLAIVAELKDLIKALIGKWRGLNRGSFPRSPHSSWKTATITTNYFSPLPTTTICEHARKSRSGGYDFPCARAHARKKEPAFHAHARPRSCTILRNSPDPRSNRRTKSSSLIPTDSHPQIRDPSCAPLSAATLASAASPPRSVFSYLFFHIEASRFASADPFVYLLSHRSETVRARVAPDSVFSVLSDSVSSSFPSFSSRPSVFVPCLWRTEEEESKKCSRCARDEQPFSSRIFDFEYHSRRSTIRTRLPAAYAHEYHHNLT